MPAAMDKISTIEKDVQEIRKEMAKLSALMAKLDQKLSGANLSVSGGQQHQASAQQKGGQQQGRKSESESKPQPKAAQKKDDDDMDLFGSDEEDDDAAEQRRQALVDAMASKKKPKPALVAKSSVVLDVKPWDDETDLKQMEEAVRSIAMEGLVWGAGKFVDVAFGIKKLQIQSVVEDEKVSVDLLTEKIQEFEDFVQSVDVAAFNKI